MGHRDVVDTTIHLQRDGTDGIGPEGTTPPSGPICTQILDTGAWMCYNGFMRTQRFQTRTERSEFCKDHDVSGCGETICRAKALGMTVERYNAWVVAPSKMVATRGRSH